MKYVYTFSHAGGNQNGYLMFVVESLNSLNTIEQQQIQWILDPHQSNLRPVKRERYPRPEGTVTKSIGPNLRFETPESEKLRAICASFGITGLLRIEKFNVVFCRKNDQPYHDRMMEAVYDKIPESLIRRMQPEKTKIIPLSSGGLTLFKEVNAEMGLGMDEFDMGYYLDLFVTKYKRNPTDVELAQIAQGNSSHSRHWEFLGKFIIDGIEMEKTLFEMVKHTLKLNPDGSIKAFSDNGGIIRGALVPVFVPNLDGTYHLMWRDMNHTATAETHNHPTLISPYPGAATGVGGRMRDISAIGRGSLIGFGGVYFQTGKLWLDRKPKLKYPTHMATPIEVLTGAILGASGWGNPFGEPTLLFGNDSLSAELENGERFESVKPIIYTCAVGSIPADAEDKAKAEPGMLIVRIGGATRRIGIGGGAASSMNAGDNHADLDFKSVQRGEPMTGRKAYNVIEQCVFMGDKNPIEAVHDQGAGGASNVLTELTNPCGGTIDLRKMQIGDPSLSQLESWIAESQELYGFLIKPENLKTFTDICKKFKCPFEILGPTNDSGRIVVQDSLDGSTPVNLTLLEILDDLPQKTYTDQTVTYNFKPLKLPDVSMKSLLEHVAQVPGVGFNGYMVDHFDGSVGGRVIQGPRVGEHQLPVCQYGIISDGFRGLTGAVSTFTRSNPIGMLIDEKATARMTVAQMLATLAFVHIPGGTKRIKGRLNVMWPFKKPGMKARLYSAYTAITEALEDAGIGIDGGKDSLSMSTSFDGETATSFPTFILEPYAHVANFRTRVTPDLKSESLRTDLVLIELENCQNRMGGSALAEAYDQTGHDVPDADLKKMVKLFKLVQYLVRKKKILAGSPKLKGGLLSTVTKMSLASNTNVHLKNPKDFQSTSFYFNEEAGVVVQCKHEDTSRIIALATSAGLNAQFVGLVNPAEKSEDLNEENTAELNSINESFLETSKQIKAYLGINPESIINERLFKHTHRLTFNPDELFLAPSTERTVFNVAVLAAPGTNGHHELAYMFGRMKRRFKVTVIQMDELASGLYDLQDFNVIAFAGGFSYGDVGGSGKGWAGSILFNDKLRKMFKDFYARPDTLSFGVCNGFQVATLLEILDESFGQRPRLVHNDSGIFEHRPVNLLIPDNTKSIMFRGMQGSILPAWSAHGEGKLLFEQPDFSFREHSGLIAVQYVDHTGQPTMEYPSNPNGSPEGIAGLCTKDGRHTFMMPHIERVSASNDHLPYRPKDWNFKKPVWGRAFENMYTWLLENKSQK